MLDKPRPTVTKHDLVAYSLAESAVTGQPMPSPMGFVQACLSCQGCGVVRGLGYFDVFTCEACRGTGQA